MDASHRLLLSNLLLALRLAAGLRYTPGGQRIYVKLPIHSLPAMQVPSLAEEGDPLPQPLETFYEWVRVQEAAGELEFEIKGAEVPVVTAGVSDEGGGKPSLGASQEVDSRDEEVC